jgi:hypothetical protein
VTYALSPNSALAVPCRASGNENVRVRWSVTGRGAAADRCAAVVVFERAPCALVVVELEVDDDPQPATHAARTRARSGLPIGKDTGARRLATLSNAPINRG